MCRKNNFLIFNTILKCKIQSPPPHANTLFSVFLKKITLLSALFLFSANLSFGQALHFCGDAAIVDKCGPDQQLLIDIDISEYIKSPTPCSVGVRLFFRVCPLPRLVEILSWQFVHVDANGVVQPGGEPNVFSSPDCAQKFFDFIASYYSPANSDTDGFQQWYKDFSVKIGHTVMDLLVQEELNKLSSIPSNLACFGPKSTISANFYEGSCQTICIGYNKPAKKFVIRKGTCGVNCCKMQKHYCIDMLNSTPGNIKLKEIGWSFASDASTCKAPIIKDGSLDFSCERGLDGEPNVFWLTSFQCNSMCKETKQAKSTNGNLYEPNEIRLTRDIGDTFLDVSIFPNPVSDLITLTFGTDFEGNVRLFDISGREVANQYLEKQRELQIKVSDFPEGVYMLHFKDKTGSIVTEKININRK